MSINKIVRWAICVVCVGFLAYKIADIGDFSAFVQRFRHLNSSKWLLLCIATILLIINFLTESVKWKVLLQNICPITLKNAVKSVIWGQTGAFITPNSLGEFPTRALNLPEGKRLNAVAMGFVGSLAQTIAIIFCGLLAVLLGLNWLLFDYKSHPVRSPFMFCFCLLILLILVAIYIFLPEFAKLLRNSKFAKIRQLSDALQFISIKQSWVVFLLSFFKYLIFSTQFWLTLNFFGADIMLYDAVWAMPIFYMILTCIPLMNLFEVAVRSSAAILVFGNLLGVDNAIVIAASTLFWLMNFVLPMLIGLFFVKNRC